MKTLGHLFVCVSVATALNMGQARRHAHKEPDGVVCYSGAQSQSITGIVDQPGMVVHGCCLIVGSAGT